MKVKQINVVYTCVTYTCFYDSIFLINSNLSNQKTIFL